MAPLKKSGKARVPSAPPVLPPMVETEAVDLWESYKNGVLKACDELSEKTKGRRDHGNTWWWNEQVKEAIDRKKKAFNTWCKNRSPEAGG